ncbi:hypothetical protein ACFFYR_31950 [Paraburkholderia dipogonis]|uniref:hypothetical protein n=1 Tax=Paraburkholderia dipogonis TaxID=1211383 RepID=UPI0031345518
MTPVTIDLEFLPLKVTHVSPKGKRSSDLAGLALKAGVNANQLRKWVDVYRKASAVAEPPWTSEPEPSAFVPVVTIGNATKGGGADSDVGGTSRFSLSAGARAPVRKTAHRRRDQSGMLCAGHVIGQGDDRGVGRGLMFRFDDGSADLPASRTNRLPMPTEYTGDSGRIIDAT